jgi:hypothetical protein
LFGVCRRLLIAEFDRLPHPLRRARRCAETIGWLSRCGLKFATTQDKVVLIDPVNMMVVGVLGDAGGN